MAGIDFDRQAFVTSSEKAAGSRVSHNILGPIILLVAIGIAGLIGYKLISSSPSRAANNAEPATVAQLQQQLEEMQKRLDALEKHRKVVAPEPAKAPEKETPAPVVVKQAPEKPAFKISSGVPQPVSHHQPPPPSQAATAQNGIQEASLNAVEDKANANHEAWQATTDRLADVVGVVGSQQGEIAQTREDVNKLLATTGRSALPFELRRNVNREPVGPVTMVLKSVDTKNKKYSVCVYVSDQCIELKDRAVNEVVAFVISKDSAPLNLVATKVLRDQIVGYLEVPNHKPAL
jgi:cell division septum initiation protein DivIVA